MSERVASIEAAAEAFRTLAAAEGDDIPMYARLCDAIAADRRAAGLLLEAPSAQRLPVLVLAALHDVVLDHPDAPLGAWYPSVGGDPDLGGDLPAVLHETLDVHRPQILDSVRHRRVQTNEVNRCVGWRAALATTCRHDDRPLALVEVGASAGLNLWWDRYRWTSTVARQHRSGRPMQRSPCRPRSGPGPGPASRWTSRPSSHGSASTSIRWTPPIRATRAG